MIIGYPKLNYNLYNNLRLHNTVQFLSHVIVYVTPLVSGMLFNNCTLKRLKSTSGLGYCIRVLYSEVYNLKLRRRSFHWVASMLATLWS